MTTEQLLIDYLARRRIRIDEKEARYIIKLARTSISENTVIVVKYRYNGVTEGWDKLRTLYIDIDVVKTIRDKNIKSIPGFYKYTFEYREPLADMYSINPSLFD